jgi:hypothetical protein
LTPSSTAPDSRVSQKRFARGGSRNRRQIGNAASAAAWNRRRTSLKLPLRTAG